MAIAFFLEVDAELETQAQAVYLVISPVKDKDEKKQNWIGRATVLYFRSDTHEKKKAEEITVQEFQTTRQI